MEKPRIAAPNESHLACVLLIDTSGSMEGDPIDNLNSALRDFKEKVSLDEMAKKRLDIAIIEFNDSARIVQDFAPISVMETITLTAGGTTAMGEGVLLAINKVRERTKLYKSLGIPTHKPWIFMITDGTPTDDIQDAVRRVQEEETKGPGGKLKFWCLGVGDYDKETLFRFFDGRPAKRVMELSDMNFDGIFNWLSESMALVSASRVGEEIKLGSLPENTHVVPESW